MNDRHDTTPYSCIPKPFSSARYGKPDRHTSSSSYQDVRNAKTFVQHRQYSVREYDGLTSESCHPNHNQRHPQQYSNAQDNCMRSNRKRMTHHSNNSDDVPAHDSPAKISKDSNTALKPYNKRIKQPQKQYCHRQQQQQQKQQHPPPHYQHQNHHQHKRQPGGEQGQNQHQHPHEKQILCPDLALPLQQHQHHHYYNNHFHYHEPGGELGKGAATNSHVTHDDDDSGDHFHHPENHQHDHRPTVSYVVVTGKQVGKAKRKASEAAAVARQQFLQGSNHRMGPNNIRSASAHHETTAKTILSAGHHPSTAASVNHSAIVVPNEQIPAASVKTNTSNTAALPPYQNPQAVHRHHQHGAGHPTPSISRKNAAKKKWLSDQRVEQARAKASEAAAATYQNVLHSYGPGHHFLRNPNTNQSTTVKGNDQQLEQARAKASEVAYATYQNVLHRYGPGDHILDTNQSINPGGECLHDQQLEQARAKASEVASATYQKILHSYGPGHHIPSNPNTNQNTTPSGKCLRDQQVEQAKAKASEAASAAYQKALQDHGAGWYCNGQMPTSLTLPQPTFDYPEPPTDQYPFPPDPPPSQDSHYLPPTSHDQYQQPDAIISHGTDESQHCVYPHSDPVVARSPTAAIPQATAPARCHDKKKTKNMKHWNEMFDLLQEFYQEEGHVNVPYNYSEKRLLGEWVQFQRNHRVTLSPPQVRKLESLGFDWLKYPATEADKDWNDNLQKLVQFHYHYGHCDVADCILDSFEHYTKLSVWIHEQKKKKKRGDLFSDYQLAQLALLGFQWSTETQKPQK